jgi:hypothetical protein
MVGCSSLAPTTRSYAERNLSHSLLTGCGSTILHPVTSFESLVVIFSVDAWCLEVRVEETNDEVVHAAECAHGTICFVFQDQNTILRVLDWVNPAANF